MRDEALTGRVQRGGPYAVVGGDADDVDLGDLAVAQPLGEAGPVLVGALEPAVRRRVRPFSNTVSIAPEATAGAKFGWKPTPSVPATQCTGQECSKSGLAEKWSPGSMWWSRVATTWR